MVTMATSAKSLGGLRNFPPTRILPGAAARFLDYLRQILNYAARNYFGLRSP